MDWSGVLGALGAVAICAAVSWYANRDKSPAERRWRVMIQAAIAVAIVALLYGYRQIK